MLQIQSDDLDQASRAAVGGDVEPLTKEELHNISATLDEFSLVMPAEEVLKGPSHPQGFRRISTIGVDEEDDNADARLVEEGGADARGEEMGEGDVGTPLTKPGQPALREKPVRGLATAEAPRWSAMVKGKLPARQAHDQAKSAPRLDLEKQQKPHRKLVDKNDKACQYDDMISAQ